MSQQTENDCYIIGTLVNDIEGARSNRAAKEVIKRKGKRG
jgi:hypothetical protein